jgi:O-methyltransferase involved in polyketide biosynthesis
MEGLLLYMTEPTVRMLLDTASAITVPRSWLGMDLVNKSLLTFPTMQPLLAAFAQRDAPVRFEANDPEALLAEYGWKPEVTRPGKQGANYGRCLT